MSKYTTEVRYICESLAGKDKTEGYSSIDEILETAVPLIFDFDYPIFDEQYRTVLEKKILRHFYTREISEETVGLWKLRLCDKLNIIMPYYNQLYKSELLEFNPLYDVDYKRGGTKNDHNAGNSSITDNTQTTGTLTNRGTTTSEEYRNLETTQNGTIKDKTDHWNLYSDTPQGSISRINLEGNSYLTNATRTSSDDERTYDDVVSADTGNVTTTNTNNLTNTNTGASIKTVTSNNNIWNVNDYIETVSGKMGTTSYAKMLLEFRDTFLNIDSKIIDELQPLFFGLW